MKILAQLVFLFFLITGSLVAQERKSEFSFMFYNTENFFDCENDTTLGGKEFLLTAQKSWTPFRFHQKTERLAKVVLAIGQWNAPVLVGLCEVENLDVLETLVRSQPLGAFHYKIIQKDSPDPRGIDVALLYRPEIFHPFEYTAIPVKDPENKYFRTRDILKVVGVLGGCDTLTVFVNHWPSRYGGIMETQRYRSLASQTLRKAVDETLNKDPDAKIVCMGDFNDTPKDVSIESLVSPAENEPALINLSQKWMKDQIQTIKSKYRWEIFDQFIVSEAFLKSQSCYLVKEAEIFKGQFLLESDTKYGGVKPKRTYLGFKYNNGFSDHLPIVLRFSLLNQ